MTLKTSIFEIYLDKKIDLIDESDSKSFDGLNIIELDDIQTSIKDIFKCLKKKLVILERSLEVSSILHKKNKKKLGM